MWTKNQDTNQWTTKSDSLRTADFESLKQDLKSLRFYQKILSGALFASINDTDNIYDVLTRQTPKTWNYKFNFSEYVKPYYSLVKDEAPIVSKSTQFDFLNKHLLEYGQTLKNLFTPARLINDQITNLIYVDVATNEAIEDLSQYNPNLEVDGIRVKEGHLVLVKDQISTVTLAETTDAESFFTSVYESISNLGSDITYSFYNDTNGVYKYLSGRLLRTNDMVNYEDCINFTVSVKLGTHVEKQFTLQRLKNDYFPLYLDGEPIFFTEKKNYVLRSRMDYNNLFELVLYDTLKHGTQSFTDGEITYSIPERTITVGEFGSIILHQEDYSNFITNKYKTNIRSIDETEKCYWMCGDDGIVLKVSKIDLSVERIFLEESVITNNPSQDKKLSVVTNLHSISFFDNLSGVVVGKYNQLWHTVNGGQNWQRIYIADFDAYNFNTALYQSSGRFYVGGDNGVFIDFLFENEGWTAFKRRISQFKTPDDEYLLVDDIKDLEYFVDNSGYFSGTASFIAIGAEGSNLFVYDIDGRINQLRGVNYDFYYVGGSATYSNNCGACSVIDSWVDNKFGDISSVTFQYSNSKLLFSTFERVYQVLPFIGAYSSTTSNILSVDISNYYTQSGINQVFSYENETIICGINSLWASIEETLITSTYSPDIYAIFDAFSMILVDAVDTANSLDLWFADFCSNNIGYDGTLYVLPQRFYFGIRPGSTSINGRWLDLPRQILSTASNGQDNFLVSRGTSFTSFVPYKMSYTQSLTLEKTYGNTNSISYLANPTASYPTTFATWSQPTDMILLGFFNKSNLYHGSSTTQWPVFNGSSPSTAYTQDYNDFVDYISPITGNPSTRLNSFTGILYPVVSGQLVTASGSIIVKIFTVTVVNAGGVNVYAIDGENKPVINLVRGGVYTFNQSNVSNSNHPLRFRVGGVGSSQYTSGVVITGTPGQNGAQTIFTVPNNAPDDLEYYCTNHPATMGNYISIVPAGEYIGGILNSNSATLVLQGISAIYGTTLSVAEIESISGLSTDTTPNYPGELFASIIDNDTSGWTDEWNDINATILTTFNPYTTLQDSNNDSGLIQHGWSIVADKRSYDSVTDLKQDVVDPFGFRDELNASLEFDSSYTTGVTVYNSEFFKELKPRLLFMDYDAGSKVYWFDDYGQYRLPERLFIPVSYLVDSTASTQSFIQFKENTNYIYDGNTGLTTSYFETNWITYWQDRSKTFEYYTHLDDAYKVLPSFTFESSNNLSGIFTYSASGITTNKTHIINLMPAIETSRYRDTGTPITAPGTLFDFYFYDFLGIWRTVVPNSSTSPKKGDILEISCSVFNGKFIINKVFSTISGGNTTYYQYFYTNFNDNILTNLSQFGGILEIKNLNKYATTTGGVKSFTSTYATSGYNQGSYKDLASDKKSSFDIEVNGAGAISLIKINKPGFGFSIGDIITLPSGTNFGGTIDVIITITDIDYNSEFISNFKNHYINYAYDIQVVDKYIPSPTASPIGLTQAFQVTGKYTHYSAYYNLQSNVEVLTTQNYLVEEDIRYQTSFLDFGYSPTYNLISYLNFLDNKKYVPTKEFLSLPCYEDMPGPDSGIPGISENDNLVYLDFVYGTYSGVAETNKIYFGQNFNHIWESFMKYTFVDVLLKEGGFPAPVGALEYKTERLLIIDKYFDGIYYVLVLHDNFAGNNNITSVSISSRRSLQQISDDLQYINRIQRPKWKEISIESGFSYTNYETDIGFKISTDAYTKALLADSDIIKDLSAIIYTDHKFELAIQIVKLENEFEFIPSNVSPSNNSKYQFSFPSEHNLENGEGISVRISSTMSNHPQILGYHSARKVDNFSIEIDVDWQGFLPGDPISIFFVKKDPFLNYQPVDIFDIGVGDKKVKQSIEILQENYDLIDKKYRLIDLDYSKYRFRLIDGLDLGTLTENFYWILDAEVSDATIGLDDKGGLVWYKGIWEGGRWFGGTWISGTWKSGDWYSGIWTSKNILDKKIQVKVDPNLTNEYASKWYSGRWFDGTWQNGTWYSGRWYGGNWRNGRWFDGTWNDGTWQNGKFTGGIWVRGIWNGGIFNTNSKRSFWLDGTWNSGDFENGEWYNGQFGSGNLSLPRSRFGTKSTSTRNSIWNAGRFTGEFHSFLNTNDNGSLDVSTRHDHSIWYTGTFNGDFYGGNAYNITFNNSNWLGGILNDISITRINTNTNSFLLDGIYRFNLNDKFYIMDDLANNMYSVFGSTENYRLYQILDTTIDEVNRTTEVVVDILLSSIFGFTLDTGVIDTGLKCVSVFKNSTWNSGIWSNGLFEDGRFYGGLWYNGNFSGIWG